MGESSRGSAGFDYGLPEGRIAQVPVEPRDAARLLVDRGPADPPEHRHVRDLPDLLRSGDLLVVNDTRVRRARLRLRKASGGAVEVLLLEPAAEPGTWEALCRPSRRVAPGTVVRGEGGLAVEVGADLGEGRRLVRMLDGDPEAHGEVPLPPYLHTVLDDPERYQTVYANVPGSVAAPTAGLHFTDDLLARCAAAGIGVASVDLAVGLGTFRPIVAADVADHRMHAEAYRVPAATLDAAAATRAAGGRVVAVGTTVVRALEAAAATGEPEGRTDIFIRRGHRFAAVDLLLTNFHQPRSSLLVLVDAFVGDRWRDLYAEALRSGYRFLSFGDAMLLERAEAA